MAENMGLHIPGIGLSRSPMAFSLMHNQLSSSPYTPTPMRPTFRGGPESALANFNKFNELLETGEYYDFTLYVGKDEKEYKVHKLILARNSGYFKTACYKLPDTPERDCDETRGIHRLVGFDPFLMEFVLYWLYTGTLSPRLLKHTHHEMQYLLIYADFFDIPSLTAELYNQLSPYITTYIREWWSSILVTTSSTDSDGGSEIDQHHLDRAMDNLIGSLIVTKNKWVKDQFFREMVYGIRDQRLLKGTRRILVKEYKVMDSEDRTLLAKMLFAEQCGRKKEAQEQAEMEERLGMAMGMERRARRRAAAVNAMAMEE